MVSKLLLESPFLLLAVLVAIQFGLICVWSWRRSPLWRRIVWSGFAAIPTLLLISVLVITTRERIIELCRDLATMAEHGDIARIGRHLADDLEIAGLNRDEFLDRVRQRLSSYRVKDARLRRFEVTRPGEGGVQAVFDAVCSIESADAFLRQMVSRWRVTFRRSGARWEIVDVEALPTPLSPIRDIRDWLP